MFNKSLSKMSNTMPVSDIMDLENHLALCVKEWVVCETENGKGIDRDSKLAEICIFNIKVIFNPDPAGKQLREFLFSKSPEGAEQDFTISRIHDLYVHISMVLPPWFIEYKLDRFVSTLKTLKYEVDADLVANYPYAWLLVVIQHSLRFTKLLRKP